MISGAVFAGKLIRHNLTDYISVVPRPQAVPNPQGRSPLDDAIYRVARLFRVLKTCIDDLDTYYQEVVSMMAPHKPLPGVSGGRSRFSGVWQ